MFTDIKNIHERMFVNIKFTYQIHPQYIICCLANGKFVYEFKLILQFVSMQRKSRSMLSASGQLVPMYRLYHCTLILYIADKYARTISRYLENCLTKQCPALHFA